MENKNLLVLILGAVAFSAAGYGVGRYTTPEKIVEKEKLRVVEVEKQVVVTQKEVEVKVVRVVEEKKDRVTTTTIETNKDGSSKTTITEKEKTDTHLAEGTTTDSKESTSSTTENSKETQKEVVKVVENQPNWHVGVGVGTHIPRSFGELATGIKPYVIVDVQRRLVGSLYGGAWGTSDGTIGLGVSLGL